jgi:hypothetical protein
LPGYGKLYESGRASGTPDGRYLERLDRRCRDALAAQGMPGRMPAHVFHGLLPTYAELAVLLEHRGFARGEPGNGQGPLARAGNAIAAWAHDRLARQRGQHAFRQVESELAMLIRGRQLRDIPGLSPRVHADVEECFAHVCRPASGCGSRQLES